ncbi:MAG: hypothetical protein NTW33_06435, partial [Methanoregula sp.]|nr:hypothetical protein [Methanoregula sp.]
RIGFFKDFFNFLRVLKKLKSKTRNFFKKIRSAEIPDLTSLPEFHDEPVFDGYRKGGCRIGGNSKRPQERYGKR